MRWASLPGFGGRIPLSSGAVEPVERFLTTVPDNSPRQLSQKAVGWGRNLTHATWFFLPDSRGSTHGLTDR